MIFETFSPQETKKIAKLLAQEIFLRQPSGSGEGALVLALKGDLGSGKTTFVQGFLKGLGIKQKITSPTFIIIKKFKIRSTKFKTVYHIDCYRLKIKKSKELLNWGFKKNLSEPQNIVLIEWPEKIKRILPKNTIWIKFRHGKNIKQRTIVVR